MTSSPLIGADDLRALLSSPTPPVLLDCSFDLADTAAGERAHAAGHLPGAAYAHLDRDLSGSKAGGTIAGGRHPLPERAAFAATVGRWGITPQTRVVCYDAQGGPYAARCWWMLRWLGHDAVQVLDGGPAAWKAAGGTLTSEAPARTAAAPYPLGSHTMPTATAAELLAGIGRVRVLDARSPDRFRGENETLDPVGGHIPGAANRFFKDNLGADGRWRPAAELRAAFEALGITAANASTVVNQCGSGVTACHNLLAMTQAGLVGSALYPGSWSEWCADPTRPVATGS